MARTRSGRVAAPAANSSEASTSELRRSPRKSAAGKVAKRKFQPNTPTRPGRISAALRDINNGMTIRTAAYVYNVKRSTIAAMKNRAVVRRIGRTNELSDIEERAIADHLLCQSDWGFPLTRMEVCMMVKHYLDNRGVDSKRFKDNMPGKRWMSNFLSRHQDLNKKVPKLINSARAKVDPASINKYFDNLEVSLEGIPPENILNFDETNLSDNPENKHVIVRRGEKYPVKVMTTSKTCISLMFAGSAAGRILPPYVVYKSKEMCESWTNGGPPGTRYNRSKSGWFDKEIFEEWFSTTLMPWAESIDGDKVVIGDNVSSHFSPKVFELCREKGIRFVCLPPNSTLLLQPLDVAFFSPLKTSWRKILNSWKQKSRNKAITLPKPAFPGLLKTLMESIEGKIILN